MKLKLLKLTQVQSNGEAPVYINIEKITSIEDVREIPLCDNYNVKTIISLVSEKEIGVIESIEKIITEKLNLSIEIIK